MLKMSNNFFNYNNQYWKCGNRLKHAGVQWTSCDRYRILLICDRKGLIKHLIETISQLFPNYRLSLIIIIKLFFQYTSPKKRRVI